jgi:7,8-dihydro-6-hydroxymethylpterin-pyrophosphokinase
MNRFKSIAAIFAFAMVIFVLPSVVSAQWRDRDDDYYRNSRYNRNIRGTLQNLKNRARNFERVTNRVEDRRDDRDDRWGRDDRWNRRGDIGRLEDLADRFRRATDDLADEYGNGRNLRGSEDEARRVLDIGNDIENELRRVRSNRNIQNEWRRISQDLRIISDVYGYNYNRNRGGDWRNRLPFPF